MSAHTCPAAPAYACSGTFIAQQWPGRTRSGHATELLSSWKSGSKKGSRFCSQAMQRATFRGREERENGVGQGLEWMGLERAQYCGARTANADALAFSYGDARRSSSSHIWSMSSSAASSPPTSKSSCRAPPCSCGPVEPPASRSNALASCCTSIWSGWAG
jgi:hypothetical protein